MTTTGLDVMWVVDHSQHEHHSHSSSCAGMPVVMVLLVLFVVVLLSVQSNPYRLKYLIKSSVTMKKINFQSEYDTISLSHQVVEFKTIQGFVF